MMITVQIDKANKMNGDWALYVSFPYDNKIVEVIRDFPSRFWDKDNKQWELPFNKLGELTSQLSDYDFDISGKYIQIEKSEAKMPIGFEFKTKPFEHQIEGFNYGLNNDRWLLGDEQGLGKALALNTKIFTPDGYKQMKDIQVGDYVFGKDGKPTKVTAVYNHSNVEMYRITFSDGVSIECCKDHLWQIHDQHGIKVVDTKWFTEKDQFGRVRKNNLFSEGSGSYKYWIDRCEPVQFNYQHTPINPYVLGALLGDGGLTSNSITFTTNDAEMILNINNRLREGYVLHSSDSMSRIDYNIIGIKGKVNTIKKDLKELGVWNTTSHTKFIPDVYKYNSIAVRTEVLQGLIDTDGYASKDNLLTFTIVSKQLCEDVRFLVESLGGIVSYSESECGYAGKITGKCYNLTIKFDKPQLYCTLTRKKSLLKDRHFKTRRNIIAVERIENADAKCITVDNNEHLYIIDHFVVTHNTKQVIDIAVAKKLQKDYHHCLIVCGVNGLKWNWLNEVHTHSNEDAWILGQRFKNHKIKIGSNADKLADVKALSTGQIQSYFIITNVETLRDEKIAEELKKLCDNKTIGLVAIDEVHKCKNPASQQGKGILKLQSECRIAMTGTPLMNQPFDLFIILKWLGYEKHAFYAFKQHHAVYGGYGGYEIVGYKNLNELQERLDDIMLRRLKNDVFDLPDKLYIDEYVEMTPKQAKIYNEVTMDIKSNIDQIKMANNPLAELIRMRQATGYTGILSSTIQESAKLDRMEELVEEAIENGKKVVIFSNWTQMTDAIYDKLAGKDYGVSVITGQTKDSDRQNIVELFQTKDYCKVLIGTIGAMGTGLTLTAGTVEIFMDEPWNKALKDQAEDRCHRIGTTQNITIYTLMCKGTIDERIHDLIEKKGAMSDALVDGKVDISNSLMLDFLLS